MIDIQEMFNKFDDDYGKFDDVTDKLHNRPDLCAMLILDKLIPGNRDMVYASSHDVIYLDVDLDELAKVATESDIRNLSRCGVRGDSDSLSMFV